MKHPLDHEVSVSVSVLVRGLTAFTLALTSPSPSLTLYGTSGEEHDRRRVGP
jgi:hypothetical protein